MRDDRLHSENQDRPDDRRSAAEHDRDRILYAAEFRRLGGITQVAPGETGHALHNRLTHVLEVAQIGRRIAQRLLREPEQAEIARAIGGVDPDVVEAACLGHDLGHPPFGHITEEVLNEQADALHVRDGFEGNAQSFRIVTKLAERRGGQDGLDLTRATLNALIKYPWTRGNRGKQARKWNCYSSEDAEFAFARALDPASIRQGAEAALMDWADDIAYSVHDMEDFYRAGKIPLERLVRNDEEVARFLDGVFAVWREHGQHEGEDFDAYADALSEVLEFFSIDRPYAGDAQQRHELKALTSLLIGRYINGIKLQQPASLGDPFVVQDRNMSNEIAMLKELTWHYVIRDTALATQQHGQRRIISGLFDTYFEACCEKRKWHIFPPRYREIAERDGADGKDNADVRVRLVCDLIAGMSEKQAVAMYHRLNGIVPGSAFAALVS